MTDLEKLRDLLYRFEYNGLVAKDVEAMTNCIAPDIIGIGMGEQGFVTSLMDVLSVMEAGVRAEDPFVHQVSFDRTEIRLHSSEFATICAHVIITSHPLDGGVAAESSFSQLLTARKIGDDWRICALHASTPVVTQEMLESYPLKLAEKTLQSLKAKMGVEAYQAEERFRQAILADTIAFYIVNFTTDIIEKCQCHSDLCIQVEDNTPYNGFVLVKTPAYVVEADQQAFAQMFCRENVLTCLEAGQRELSLEYRLRGKDGEGLWAQTVLRVIADPSSTQRRGILYVRNIDQTKRAQLALMDKATLDGMTHLLNKEAVVQGIAQQLGSSPPDRGACLAILDIDDFKDVNDSYGHPVGDQALIAVAEMLQSSFQESTLIGRLGGDEFCVFLTCSHSTAQLEERFTQLLDKIKGIRLAEAPQARLSCSVGLALQQPGEDFAALYRRADHALYHAKGNGKDQLSFYH